MGCGRSHQHGPRNFDEYRLEPEELIDAGDEVVGLVYQRGRIKGGSDPIEQRIGYVCSVQDGKTVRVQVYFSWEEALRDAEQDSPAPEGPL
jgi:ketosteroid isomerase-like protein